ncbi:hypothetical protein Zmor_001271 [Zophobas morio]|uniref:Uncharacterized protein n=1 Tax=Zophobas morio TaxID=2755281 RepID=A0AA38MSI1_9CUCU|nr:hypothetical protein Zmor_001271 [Zophobas morio]
MPCKGYGGFFYRNMFRRYFAKSKRLGVLDDTARLINGKLNEFNCFDCSILSKKFLRENGASRFNMMMSYSGFIFHSPVPMKETITQNTNTRVFIHVHLYTHLQFFRSVQRFRPRKHRAYVVTPERTPVYERSRAGLRKSRCLRLGFAGSGFRGSDTASARTVGINRTVFNGKC